ncbi:MAG: S8/S53 family peptidase [Oscillospiraceae bacterium]|nr:S8/S53 family peptidase [Oscillospiraceae bacterium]
MKISLLLLHDARVINFSICYPRSLLLESGRTEKDLRVAALAEAGIMSTALKRCLHRGRDFVLVNAAGNNHCDAFDSWWIPAITDEEIKSRCLVVGASKMKTEGPIARNDLSPAESTPYEMCAFSNDGPRVDLIAPGYKIYSCIETRDGQSEYQYLSGSSLSSAYVTAACAALWAYYPALSGADIKSLLLETSDVPVSGSDLGMLNLRSAFGNLAQGQLPAHEQLHLPEILDAYRTLGEQPPKN